MSHAETSQKHADGVRDHIIRRGSNQMVHIEELQRLQYTIGLRLANKLSQRHIYFDNNKMKVSVSV